MLMNTRRRALALLAAAAGLRFIPFPPSALAKTTECFALQPFGQWKGVATQAQAGACAGVRVRMGTSSGRSSAM